MELFVVKMQRQYSIKASGLNKTEYDFNYG